jgi:hypothetical protein
MPKKLFILDAEEIENPCDTCSSSHDCHSSHKLVSACNLKMEYDKWQDFLAHAHEIIIKEDSAFYRNCKFNRQRKCRCCSDCPFSQLLQSNQSESSNAQVR